MQLEKQKAENQAEEMFYFFVVPAAVTICALVMLWQVIFH